MSRRHDDELPRWGLFGCLCFVMAGLFALIAAIFNR